ncbi:MAG: Rpp14/Pop5 family protein [Candidatus Bathyarchaeota archaeon]|nr:Rpp14/Pop5 family protein [Candidatus Bathyarchaeota archaeon]
MKRMKRRYLALHLECEGIPTERDLMDTIWMAITRLFGEVGASLTGLALITFNIERKEVVIRTSLASLPMVRASLPTITNISGQQASLHVLAVSGTIKSLINNIEQ